MACLDTTLLVDLVRPGSTWRTRAFQKVRQLLDDDEFVVTTRLNIAELYVGVERSDRPDREAQRVSEVLQGLGVLDFDDNAARLFGRITAYLQEIGRPAGDMDVLIAATSLAAGHTLVTRNSGHFAHIPELVVETY